MTNIYWPIYKNLETGTIKLSYSIHIDDQQLNVYSSNISDMILRASAEIESISKELYKRNGGTKVEKIRYDSDALELLNDLWKLDKKIVIISSPNCFQSVKEIWPFVKNENSTFHNKMTFSWNNSYQNLKHDRANSLHFGSLKYLFDILAALFVLNLYYKDEIYNLKRDSNGTNFPINMGSDLFAIKLHKWFSYDGQFRYGKNIDFDECIYLTKSTDESLVRMKKSTEEMQNKQRELFLNHPKFTKYLQENKIQDYSGSNFLWDVLGKDEYLNILRIAGQNQLKVYDKTEYEAVLNKNGI